MKEALTSKTIQVALAFAGMGLALIIFDTILGITLGYQVHFIIEFFGLLSAMFTGLATKNSVDNYFAYSERKTTMLAGVNLESLPPKPEL